MDMGWKLFVIHCKDIAPRLHNWILCEISLQYCHLSDNYGRLPAILLSNVITMLAGMALPLAGGYVSFCILRFVERNYISSFPKSGFSFSLMMKYQKNRIDWGLMVKRKSFGTLSSILQVHHGDSVQYLLYHSIYIRYDESLSLLFVQYFLAYQNIILYGIKLPTRADA